MKKCIFCRIAHDDTDNYCMECGKPSVFGISYADYGHATVGDIVFRATFKWRQGRPLPVRADVLEVHVDDTVTVKWSNRKKSERIPAKSLRLSFSAKERAKHQTNEVAA